ncbi:hypothetical protein ACFXK0_19770 [Nocardia sp. NPDC059177]|uniref:hypothetical protein n=1 Tax=Nocardia sp. NPDC059177 TaxID=3346759 RepID=UPI0036A4D381
MNSPIRDIEIIQEISARVFTENRAHLPVIVTVCKLGSLSNGRMQITSSGEYVPAQISTSIYDLMLELREVMARPGSGAWLTAEIQVTDDGRAATRFDYNSEIEWTLGQPEGRDYQLELEKYPRDAEHIPQWWQDILDNPPAEWQPSPEWIAEMESRLGYKLSDPDEGK